MWQITAALALASGMQSAAAYRKAGKQARREAVRQAAELERSKADIALAARQDHQNRMMQFQDLVSYNSAAAAATGREGRSIEALRKREQDLYSTDINRLNEQAMRETEKVERQRQAVLAGGAAARSQYREMARQSLLGAAFTTAQLFDSSIFSGRETAGGTSSVGSAKPGVSRSSQTGGGVLY